MEAEQQRNSALHHVSANNVLATAKADWFPLMDQILKE